MGTGAFNAGGSYGSREGAQGVNPLILGKKEEITEGRRGGGLNKTTPPPLSSRSGTATGG